ncbi:RDD family protein [Termitidicoccus mucosus]|uniref:RDD domain-containing protein n=2 Tax=Termitidicoccus mucosus TaxID=1184151 RepID=A0A178IPR6_9BACT|nr:hypothetical protein AW736_01370 [Opitutaceae bacterium TSB47]
MEQIKIWIREGLLSPHTLAIKTGETTWKKLYSYPEFFAIGPTQPPFSTTELSSTHPPGAPYLSRPAMPFQAGTVPGAFNGAHSSRPPVGVTSLPIVQHDGVRIALPADRIMAALVDGLMWMLSLLPLWFCLTLYFSGAVTNWASLKWAVLFPFATAISCLVIQGWMQAARGQSIGKSLLRLRIVPSTSDDEPPGFVTGVIVRWLLMWLFYLFPVVALVDFFFLFRDDRRCLHDHLADTRVIVMDE